MKFKADFITFDFGDTLVSSDPPYLTRIWLGLKELGVKKALKEVECAYHNADFKVSKNLLKKKRFAPELYQQELGEGLLAELGIKNAQEELLKELSLRLSEFRPERVIVPGADVLLKELSQRGYRMGIISNNDGRTREKCRAVGIENYFEFILDSTLEGMVKPDPKFFRKALSLAGVSANQAIHIGDLLGSDILGAVNIGIRAIWIENKYLKPVLAKNILKVKKPDQVLNYIA